MSYPARSADPDEPWWSELRDSAARQVASAVTQAQRVTFVAKSLGTKALASLDSEALAGKEVDAIWLTPLFSEPDVHSGAIELGWRSLLVAGQADSYHQPEHHEAVRDALSAASVVLPVADHRLECPPSRGGRRRAGDRCRPAPARRGRHRVRRRTGPVTVTSPHVAK